MASCIAKHLHDDIRCAVGNHAMTTVVWRARNEHVQTNDAGHPIEPVARGCRDLRQHAERGQPRSLNAVLVGEVVAEAADVRRLSVSARYLAGNMEQMSVLHKWHVIGSGR